MQSAVSRYIGELADIGGLKGTDIANITDVSKATVSRWKAGDIKPQPKNELICPTSITSSAGSMNIIHRTRFVPGSMRGTHNSEVSVLWTSFTMIARSKYWPSSTGWTMMSMCRSNEWLKLDATTG